MARSITCGSWNTERWEAAILRVGMILPPGFQVMSFAPLSVFEVANGAAGERLYDVQVLSEQGSLVPNSFGMEVTSRKLSSEPFDTILVGAGPDVVPSSPKVLSFLRNAVGRTRRIASICIGAFTFGEAGLLDGRRVTTHWAFSEDLQRRFPKAKVEMDRIYI